MNCIIVDDEPLARQGISHLIAGDTSLQLLGCFNSALSAMEYLSLNQVDLIFLDIRMPEMTGLELARAIPKETLIIFITAYAAYALDSYEVTAIDYLVKPVSKERFYQAVKKAHDYLQLLHMHRVQENTVTQINDDFIFIKSDRRYHKIFLRELLYIEGLKDYVVIYHREEKVITGMNLRTIYAQLPQPLFVRVSKSYIVNISQITSLDNNTIFIGSAEVPIGNSFRKAFFEQYVKKHLISKQV
ncbi:LytR/AlgR family response regulator transcription factor [Chitinophaga nivalis]|uniref:LytTR family DNA-binding domain-containing protein n=1 Tax=Chitinophaga nivalis TaxID=2991709 RepID=A0ABT3ITN0_9BACT|nr:LytTR family DNA-binding domain-containing protein [Chitinophaga nivalis]MCW3462968.1 LytTR family DNA-binding domain-containing protein [Chitinophaga nivalis]MCW3487342.1 LytTR family DNA-binding domain-containing protein [Chitinophaga nivalis]